MVCRSGLLLISTVRRSDPARLLRPIRPVSCCPATERSSPAADLLPRREIRLRPMGLRVARPAALPTGFLRFAFPFRRIDLLAACLSASTAAQPVATVVRPAPIAFARRSPVRPPCRERATLEASPACWLACCACWAAWLNDLAASLADCEASGNFVSCICDWACCCDAWACSADCFAASAVSPACCSLSGVDESRSAA